MTTAEELQKKGMADKDLVLYLVNSTKNRKLKLPEIKIITDYLEEH